MLDEATKGSQRPVEFFTDLLRVTGELDTAYHRRLSDALNGQEYEYFTLRNATLVFRDAPKGVGEARTALLTLPKREIILARPLAEPESAPDAPRTGTYDRVRKTPRPVLIYAGVYLITGNIHLIPELSFRDILDIIKDTFLALTDVVLAGPSGAGPIRFQFPFASVNKERIVAMMPAPTETHQS